MSNDSGVYVTLRNDGIGPARVEDIRIRYQGKDRVEDPYDFYVAVRPDAFKAGQISVDKVTQGRLLPAGAQIQMLGIGGVPDRGPMLVDMLRLFALADVPKAWLVSNGALNPDKAVIIVTYTSVYGDRWRLRSDEYVPQAF